METELGQTVGQINVDRSNSPLAGLRVAGQKSVIFLLHESASVSVSPYGLRRMVSLLASTPVTMSKNCRVLCLALRPSTETEVTFLTTDGRVLFLRLGSSDSPIAPSPITSLSSLPTKNMLLMVSSILPSLSPSKAVRMFPPLTTKNWGEYRPLLAVGTHTVDIHIVNVSAGVMEREIAVHSAPVLGFEWTSTNPVASMLSFAYSPITGSSSGLVRNELVHMDIITGKLKHLRTEQGRETGEPKITMIRVSHLKKYFVVAFASGPFELWDLTKLCILRTMPKKSPHIYSIRFFTPPDLRRVEVPLPMKRRGQGA